MPRLRLTTTDVRSLLGSPDAQIIDGRANPEFRGHEGNSRRLGHIPGAINIPFGPHLATWAGWVLPYDRPTWDLTSVLYAVRPEDGYFSLSDAGRIVVDDEGRTRFERSDDGDRALVSGLPRRGRYQRRVRACG